MNRSINRLLSIKSPQSVLPVEEDYDFDSSFTNPNVPIFSVLKSSHNPSKERIQYLWKRLRTMMKVISTLIKTWKHIQVFGGARNHYSINFAREESHDFEKDLHNFLIFPQSMFSRVWTIIILALLIYTATVVPYTLCFFDTLDESWYILENCTDLLFFCDIIVTFNSAYYSDELEIVQDRKNIAMKYIKTWFFIDLVACFPIQIAISNNHSYNKLIRFARIPRLYKVLRFLKLFKLVRVIKSFTFISELIEKLKMIDGILKLLNFFLTLLLVVHVNGCLWYFIARIDENSSETWIVRYQFNTYDQGQLYLASVYYVTQTIATIGFGDIVPVTTYERVYTLCLMLIGVGFYSYIVGNLSTIVKNVDTETAKLASKLSALNEFAKATRLSHTIKNDIKKHIETTSKTNFSHIDKSALLKELPIKLRQEVNLHMYKKIVEKILFFQDKDPNFISQFVSKLKTLELNCGEIVYEQEDYAEEIYFISKGRVTLKTENGVVFKNYMQGAYFGEIEVINNTTRKNKIQVASAHATLLIISKREFLIIMKDYPEVYKEVKSTAKIREIKHEEAKTHMLKSILSSKNDLNKAKTTNEAIKDKQLFRPFVRHQGWKNFLKNSLGIKEHTEKTPFFTPQSVWEKYITFKNTKNPNKRYMSENSISELIERVEFPGIGSSEKNPVVLPKGNFAEICKEIRADKYAKKMKEIFEVQDFSFVGSISESEHKNGNINIGYVLEELKIQEKRAKVQFEDINKILKEMLIKQDLFNEILRKFLK